MGTSPRSRSGWKWSVTRSDGSIGGPSLSSVTWANARAWGDPGAGVQTISFDNFSVRHMRRSRPRPARLDPGKVDPERDQKAAAKVQRAETGSACHQRRTPDAK